jgi:hypothetical protein
MDLDARRQQPAPRGDLPRRRRQGAAHPAVRRRRQRKPRGPLEDLAAYEDKTGGRVLAIPHNGNISGGQMFALVDFAGNALTRKYAEARARWEPVMEATQQKATANRTSSSPPATISPATRPGTR